MTARLLPEERARTAHIGVMRNIALNIPDPAVYASYMPARLAVSLKGAWKRGRGQYAVSPYDAAILRPYGLCGYESNCLTAYGLKVRRALKAMDGLAKAADL